MTTDNKQYVESITISTELGFMGVGTAVTYVLRCYMCTATLVVNELHSLGDPESFTAPPDMTAELSKHIAALASNYAFNKGWRVQSTGGSLLMPNGPSGFGPDGNHTQRSRVSSMSILCPDHNKTK